MTTIRPRVIPICAPLIGRRTEVVRGAMVGAGRAVPLSRPGPACRGGFPACRAAKSDRPRTMSRPGPCALLGHPPPLRAGCGGKKKSRLSNADGYERGRRAGPAPGKRRAVTVAGYHRLSSRWRSAAGCLWPPSTETTRRWPVAGPKRPSRPAAARLRLRNHVGTFVGWMPWHSARSRKHATSPCRDG